MRKFWLLLLVALMFGCGKEIPPAPASHVSYKVRGNAIAATVPVEFVVGTTSDNKDYCGTRRDGTDYALPVAERPLTAYALSSDGNYLVAGRSDGMLGTMELANGKAPAKAAWQWVRIPASASDIGITSLATEKDMSDWWALIGCTNGEVYSYSEGTGPILRAKLPRKVAWVGMGSNNIFAMTDTGDFYLISLEKPEKLFTVDEFKDGSLTPNAIDVAEDGRLTPLLVFCEKDFFSIYSLAKRKWVESDGGYPAGTVLRADSSSVQLLLPDGSWKTKELLR